MNVRDAILMRRSASRFEPDGLVLARDTIESLIREACHAPTEENLQPWRFLVVRDRSRREALYDCTFHDVRVREASAVIVVCGDTRAYEDDRGWAERQVSTGAMTRDRAAAFSRSIAEFYRASAWDRGLLAVRGPCFAAMNLMLLATERGIASAPIFRYSEDLLRATFHISERYLPVAMIALGLRSTSVPPERPVEPLESSRMIFHEDLGMLEP